MLVEVYVYEDLCVRLFSYPPFFSQSHRTALEEAVHGNHMETVKLLMEASSRHKANVCIHGVEPAKIAFCKKAGG